MKRKKQRKKKIKKSLKKFGSLKKVFTFTTSNKENEKRVSIKNRKMENIKLPTKGKSEVIASGMYRYLLTVWQGDVYLIERFDKDWKNPNVVLETMDSDKVMEYIDNFLTPIK